MMDSSMNEQQTTEETHSVVPAGHPERPAGDDGRAMLARMNSGAHEELALWGLSHIAPKAGARMLDVGCGGGANLARLLALAENAHVTGMDYAPLAIEVSLETNAEAVRAGVIDVIEGSVDKMPFADAHFDVATAFETIYFWPHVDQSLVEVHRVLKSGGTLLICNEANGQTANANEIAEELDIMTIYTADDLRALLEAASFEVVEVDDEGETGRITVVARAM